MVSRWFLHVLALAQGLHLTLGHRRITEFAFLCLEQTPGSSLGMATNRSKDAKRCEAFWEPNCVKGTCDMEATEKYLRIMIMENELCDQSKQRLVVSDAKLASGELQVGSIVSIPFEG